jgi:APA family basic amino acid/polyamine antiporter
VKNSKILQTVLTVIKVLSLAGLIIFGFMAQIALCGMQVGQRLKAQSLNVKQSGCLLVCALISGISAAFVGSPIL